MVIVTGIALKLEQFGRTFSSLNPCPFLPSVATTDDRNQFQCLKIFLNNKFAALFLGLILGGDGKDYVMDYHTLSHFTQVYKFGYQKIKSWVEVGRILLLTTIPVSYTHLTLPTKRIV